ncbi:MAG: oligopeptide/dipeptide ABC transporter ATP-binding protein [Roseobacter sp.]
MWPTAPPKCIWGRFVEGRPTKKVFAARWHPDIVVLFFANPEPDPDKTHDCITLPAEVPSLRARLSGCEFYPRCPKAQAQCRVTAPRHWLRDAARSPVIFCWHPARPAPKPERTA